MNGQFSAGTIMHNRARYLRWRGEN